MRNLTVVRVNLCFVNGVNSEALENPVKFEFECQPMGELVGVMHILLKGPIERWGKISRSFGPASTSATRQQV